MLNRTKSPLIGNKSNWSVYFMRALVFLCSLPTITGREMNEADSWRHMLMRSWKQDMYEEKSEGGEVGQNLLLLIRWQFKPTLGIIWIHVLPVCKEGHLKDGMSLKWPTAWFPKLCDSPSCWLQGSLAAAEEDRGRAATACSHRFLKEGPSPLTTHSHC